MLFISRSMAGALIMAVTYGIDVKSIDDPFLRATIDANLAFFTVLVPGKFLVDVLPICEHPHHSIIPVADRR
jgi:hypothetical protein